MSSDSDAFDEYYYQYKLTVYNNLFVGIVFGVYIVLYVTSVHILLRKPGFTSSRLRMSMFGITTFMFVLGIIALVLETTLGFQQTQQNQTPQLFPDPTGANLRSTYIINVVFAVEATITRLVAVQYIISDIICAWRAVVLWDRDKRIIAILLLLILATTAAAGYELVLSLAPSFRFGFPYDLIGANETAGDAGPLIMVGPTLGTNLVSTALIAWKAWQHRVLVRKHLGEATGSVKVERVFALLIESGFIYCCLWVLYLISAFYVIPDPGLTIMEHVLVFASGLYPTLIIILVAMQKSPVEHFSTYSTPMQFAGGPAPRPTRAGDMQQHLHMTRREYASDSDTHVPSAGMVFMVIPDEERAYDLRSVG
ncbi:hypothetical protein EDB92DRAFT_377444 [Lactarius akahatsu]|uniref:Uncharacterized protein n=1 Tax=Lactarius akahatsu TaxID=416441 RepID=A0AAD4QEV8_9AGAM|nr:hypothetical protein EDB92DRAFT_377444 [Lactarius akahatsu]